jgi:hypothetical protein
MAYEIISVPFSKNLDEMSKNELREYFYWFLSKIPERTEVLHEQLQSTPSFRSWRPNHTPESLLFLGQWFAAQVETRPAREDEAQFLNKAPVPVKISPDWKLTLKTLSLVMDVGMYLGATMQKNHCDLRWCFRFTGKSWMDYGHPALLSFRVGPLVPCHISTVLAYGIASQKKGGDSLKEVYDIWSAQVDHGEIPKQYEVFQSC